MYLLKIFLTSLFLFISLSVSLKAQQIATATMKVSVTIVSGATLESVNAIELDGERNLLTGSFSYTTSKFADSSVETEKIVQLKNQLGHMVVIEPDIEFSESESKSVVKVSSLVGKKLAVASGAYTGELRTVVNYF